MSTVPVSTTIREILSKELELPADEVIKRAKARGVTAEESVVRSSVHNVRSELRKKAAKAKTEAPAPAAAPPQQPLIAPEPDAAFERIVLANKFVALCGGIKEARDFLKVVEACGGVATLMKHVDLIADIRGEKAT